MAQILIRGLDQQVVDRLKERARLHGRSLESEARLILESATPVTMKEARQITHEWRDLLAGQKFDDSADLIREDRDR